VKPTPLHETTHMTVAALGPFCLGRWRTLPDVDGFRAMQRDLAAWAEDAPPFVAINVIDLRSLVQVSDDVRKEIARVQESFAHKQLGLATVIAERGFYAAAVRGVAGAVQLLSRAKFPQRVFADAADAAAWGVSLTGGEFSAVDVVKALAELGAPKT
jgi:hypothetical protein